MNTAGVFNQTVNTLFNFLRVVFFRFAVTFHLTVHSASKRQAKTFLHTLVVLALLLGGFFTSFALLRFCNIQHFLLRSHFLLDSTRFRGGFAEFLAHTG